MLGLKPNIKIGDVVILKKTSYGELEDLDLEAEELGWYGEHTKVGTFEKLKHYLGRKLIVSHIECNDGHFEVEEDEEDEDRGHWSFSVAWIDSIISIPTPRNNDGRAICFWCNVPTQKRGGGLYDVCPKCGK